MREKISQEEKAKYVKMYLNGEGSYEIIAKKAEVSSITLQEWVFKFRICGYSGLSRGANKKYSNEIKITAVEEYLDGKSTYFDICKKYKIVSKRQLRKWISIYNSHEEFKLSKNIGVFMTKGRSTTLEERIEIVAYCIENNKDFNKTASKYEVSYQQVYSWVSKFKNSGIDGLIDKRDQRKSVEEMSELEIIKAKNKILEAKIKKQEMEIAFLKKLEEIERRGF